MDSTHSLFTRDAMKYNPITARDVISHKLLVVFLIGIITKVNNNNNYNLSDLMPIFK